MPNSRGTQLQTTAKVREIFMPALSSTMTEGKLVDWLKSPGDKVNKGETVVVVESDKADMDVESFYDGFLAAITIEAGEVATVGAPIAYIADTEAEIEEAKAKASGGGSTSTPPPAAPQAAASPPPPPPPPAAAPAVSEPVANSPKLSTPKTSTPPPEAMFGAPTGSVAPGPTAEDQRHPAVKGTRTPKTGGGATPFAIKLAKKNGIDIAQVPGSGPRGRVDGDDVIAFMNGTRASPSSSGGVTPAAIPAAAPSPATSTAVEGSTPPASAPATGGETGVVPFTSLQLAVSKNMVSSLDVPVFRCRYSMSTDKLDALYKQVKGKGVTMTALLSKALAMAIAKHPIMNAAYSGSGSGGISYNDNINIAVAVAMDDGGLITPVLRNADKVDLFQLSRNWKDLVDRARTKSLKPEEYSTGTFTLSNLGMFGVDSFDAILPPGQGSIIAVGSSQAQLRANADGSFAVQKVMTVNITCDHRVIYGADAAAFLKTLAAIIENPEGSNILM